MRRNTLIDKMVKEKVVKETKHTLDGEVVTDIEFNMLRGMLRRSRLSKERNNE